MTNHYIGCESLPKGIKWPENLESSEMLVNEHGNIGNRDATAVPPASQIPDLPALKWILVFCVVWIAVGLVPTLLVMLGKSYLSVLDSESVGVAGTIGDSFGFVNSFFSSAALLFIIWSIRLQKQEITFAQQELIENTQSQKEQANLMKETAVLTAINHIYQHFNHDYGKTDGTGVLSSLADGHRRWAIRETFNSLDGSHESYVMQLIEDDLREIRKELQSPSQGREYLQKVASLVSSIILDKRIANSDRNLLLPIYRILSNSPGSGHVTENSFKQFEFHCKEFISNSNLSQDSK